MPVDFIPLALGPATGQRILIRRPSRLILIGDVRVPQVSVRAERTPNGGRVIVDIDPPAPHKVTREGNRLIVRFDATAIDAGAVAAQVPEYVTGARIDGTTLSLTLGPSAAEFRAEDDRDGTPLTIDLSAAPPPPPPLPPPPPGARRRGRTRRRQSTCRRAPSGPSSSTRATAAPTPARRARPAPRKRTSRCSWRGG